MIDMNDGDHPYKKKLVKCAGACSRKYNPDSMEKRGDNYLCPKCSKIMQTICEISMPEDILETNQK